MHARVQKLHVLRLKRSSKRLKNHKNNIINLLTDKRTCGIISKV